MNEADAQRREVGGGYSLVILTPEVVEIEEEVKQAEEEREGIDQIIDHMAVNRETGSSYWSGRGSQSRERGTSLSRMARTRILTSCESNDTNPGNVGAKLDRGSKCNYKCMSLSGWVDWNRKMDTMVDGMTARKLVDGTITSLPTHRRALIDEKVTYSDMNERVHHLKIMIKPGCDERCVASDTEFWTCIVPG